MAGTNFPFVGRGLCGVQTTLFAIIALAMLQSPTEAGGIVDTQNLNFSTSWQDMPDESGGHYMMRTYGSRSLYDGIFGFGWCSFIESRIYVEEGNIVHSVCGSGRKTMYLPLNGIRGERIFRSEDGSQISFSGDQYVLTPAAWSLSSETRDGNIDDCLCGVSYVKPSGDSENSVSFEDPTRMTFNKMGYVVEIETKKGGRFGLVRNDGAITHIISPNGAISTFRWTAQGKVLSIADSSGKVANFTYDDSGNLVYVLNSFGTSVRYVYDNFANVLEIYKDEKPYEKLTYNVDKDWVTSFSDESGCQIETIPEVIKDAPDPSLHYVTYVKRICNGVNHSFDKYEFIFRSEPGNGVYLYRFRRSANGMFTEYVADARGRVNFKSTPLAVADVHETAKILDE